MQLSQPHSPAKPLRLLFVCLGNICRSPTAEGVMRSLVQRSGLDGSVHVESAGTGSWHVGSPPDPRAAQVGHEHGTPLEGRARQVRAEDFEDFDLLIAMDSANASALRRLAPGGRERAKVRLLREFDRASAAVGELDVPDPYYGASGGFHEVFGLIQAACEGLLEQIRSGELVASP